MHGVEGAAEDQDRHDSPSSVYVNSASPISTVSPFAAPCRGQRSIDARGPQLALQAGNRLVVLEVDTADHPLDKLANHTEPVVLANDVVGDDPPGTWSVDAVQSLRRRAGSVANHASGQSGSSEQELLASVAVLRGDLE